ncbi:hypothetical protein HT576_01325 [Haloterrigena sp. SYSU A121-1]|uniref:Uncharacterized protein n=1 Tax=Haloterrigena gelatinilytica TaxID=2741724 RepID=A0A8J8GHD3_9EURY|nr:hypothetical protein [Haloterrigena gelatinilytica]NUB89676.1 hypothetical protein [Haloterrigena gelatinilytica]
MSSQNARLETGGFVPFYRSYTKTWIHAVATAGLTAFGTLTIVHRWFAALALASYVVPPIVLYLRHGRNDDRADADRGASTPERDESPTESEPESDTPKSESNHAEPESEPSGSSRAEPDATDTRDALESPPSSDDDGESTAADGTADAAVRDAREKPEPESEREWHAVEAPTDATLRDVAVAAADDTAESSAAYAVGDGGIVLADDGDEWAAVLEDGPAAGGNDLRGVDATTDGEAVWVAGDSGAVGRIDAETGRHTDFTAPEEITDNWLGVAVGGASGAETVLLINGSGAMLRGTYGADGDGRALEWTGPEKPGSGSSLSGVAFADDAVGYCCDTNDGVFETTDGGESFDRVGLEGADGTLTDVATAGRDDCLASADDGVVHRYDGPTWTPERVADDALTGVARREERAMACAADGAVHERAGGAAGWKRTDTDAAGALLAVSLGAVRAVAVGEEGTIVARG